MIEDHKTQKNRGGRKTKAESRTAEFRRELIVWKQTPESMRPSLRKLAGRLGAGATHQILSYHLSRLDRWQAQEGAKRIRAEGRPFTAGLVEAMGDTLWRIKQEAKRGPLKSDQVKMLKLFVRQGWRGAKEILEKCRPMTPQEERKARAAEKATMFTATALKNIERIKQEAERGPLPWRDIEILKILARRKCSGAKELLQKYSNSALPRPQVLQ